MKKVLSTIVLLLMMAANVNAQGFLRGLGQAAKERVKQKVENKVLDTVDEATDEVLNGKSKSTRQVEDADEEPEVEAAIDDAPAAKPKKKAQGEAVKSDFVPGSVVIFEDDFANEQMGEFPSKWDLIENNAEVARLNGRKCIKFEHGSNTEITPLLEDGNKKYLPEVYTLEFDYFITGEEDHTSAYRLYLKSEDDGDQTDIFIGRENISWGVVHPTSSNTVDGNASLEDINEQEEWNHFALSFNKRALKVYINGRRVINIPNAKAMDWFSLFTEFWEDHIDYITNVRLAKGGVALYDRNAQSMTAVEKAMQETGKFVTNNIFFETGKADLKSESMAEIEKVAEYMKKNPSVRFEVQGHTDNQGSDAINDPLSQKRAEAIVKALVGLGVDEWNLRAVGKGSHEPVADNKTDEGRAKNRRVEFIKK